MDRSGIEPQAQRRFDPKSHPPPFTRNSVFPTKSNDFVSSSVDETKVRRTCLARAWHALGDIGVTLLARPVQKVPAKHGDLLCYQLRQYVARRERTL